MFNTLKSWFICSFITIIAVNLMVIFVTHGVSNPVLTALRWIFSLLIPIIVFFLGLVTDVDIRNDKKDKEESGEDKPFYLKKYSECCRIVGYKYNLDGNDRVRIVQGRSICEFYVDDFLQRADDIRAARDKARKNVSVVASQKDLKAIA